MGVMDWFNKDYWNLQNENRQLKSELLTKNSKPYEELERDNFLLKTELEKAGIQRTPEEELEKYLNDRGMRSSTNEELAEYKADLEEEVRELEYKLRIVEANSETKTDFLYDMTSLANEQVEQLKGLLGKAEKERDGAEKKLEQMQEKFQRAVAFADISMKKHEGRALNGEEMNFINGKEKEKPKEKEMEMDM